MIDTILITFALVAALGAGLMAGVFFAFSTFVMKALGSLPAGAGIAAMQSINGTVINPMFLGAFFGTAVACAVATGGALMHWEKPGAAYLLAGGALYLFGTFGVTIAFNVPLNNALAAVAPESPDGAARWTDYLARWTAWNHVRTAAALAALGSFVVALRN